MSHLRICLAVPFGLALMVRPAPARNAHRVVILAPDLFQVSRLERQAEAALPENDDLVVLDWQALVPGLKQAIQADLSSALFMYPCSSYSWGSA